MAIGVLESDAIANLDRWLHSPDIGWGDKAIACGTPHLYFYLACLGITECPDHCVLDTAIASQ